MYCISDLQTKQQNLLIPVSQSGKKQDVQCAELVISFGDITTFCGFLLHPVCLCRSSSHTCWTVIPECLKDCRARQSRSMCETNRAKNNRIFCTTGSAFKDTSTELAGYFSRREEELWSTWSAERRDGVLGGMYVSKNYKGDRLSKVIWTEIGFFNKHFV